VNDELLHALLTDLDPVRDLSDEALNELSPIDQLMTRVTLGVRDVAPPRRGHDRRPISVVVASTLAAGVLALGGVAIASHTLSQHAPALGPSTASSWSRFTATTPLVDSQNLQGLNVYGPAWTKSSGDVVTFSDLVARQRFVGTFAPDGIVIEPAPSTITTTVSATSMAKVVWATTQLRGYHATAFGFALVTTSLSTARVPEVRQTPAWVGIAFRDTPRTCASGEALNHGGCVTVDYSQLAIVVVSDNPHRVNTGVVVTPPAFVYTLSGAGRPVLAPATEQVSVPWRQVGPVRDGQLRVSVSSLSCATLDGYSLLRSGRTTTVTVRALIPDDLLGSYCGSAGATRRVISLTTTRRGARTWLVSPDTTFVPAPLGALNATS
jgi:hypothetical protein